MSTTPHHSQHHPEAPGAVSGTRRLLWTGAIAGAIAAVGTTVVAAIGSAADASLEVSGTEIPLAAFAWWTVVGAAVGVLLARFIRERRRFTMVTVVATALSLIPAVTLPDDTGTKVVLVIAHVLAAAIVIPPLGRELPANGGRTPLG